MRDGHYSVHGYYCCAAFNRLYVGHEDDELQV